MHIATAVTSPNIAVIKYWGNRNNDLVLPTNNSISFTMDEKLQTKTTVIFDEEFTLDELWINDKKASEKETQRVSSFLNVVRVKGNCKLYAKVFSENSFPKSAGLASSASAFSALAGASTRALNLNLTNKELSVLARLGSGSASRSVFGGAVEWKKGIKEDGSDCYSEQIAPKENFKKLRNVIAIVEKEEKKVGSREGMEITVKTSPSFSKRLEKVENRLKLIREGVKEFNFQKIAPVIMDESDSMHSVMEDSSPPLNYLNSTSKKIINKIRELNSENNEFVGAYTFDAGPNAHIYTLENNVDKIKSGIKEIDGIREIMECSIGDGLKFTESHLM